MTSYTFGSNNVVVEAKMLEGTSGIMSGRANVNGMREQIGLIAILTIVVRMDIEMSRSNGGTVGRHDSERYVEKKTTDK
jgi:hypothetical protein